MLVFGAHYDYRVATPDMVARRDRMAEIRERHASTCVQSPLQLCAAHPVVASIIPGSKAPAKVCQNAQMMTVAVPRAP